MAKNAAAAKAIGACIFLVALLALLLIVSDSPEKALRKTVKEQRISSDAGSLKAISSVAEIQSHNTKSRLRTSLPNITLPPPAITADHLAVIVNERDPLSIQIGKYYQQQRKIPDSNIINIAFDPGSSVMPPDEFEKLINQVNAAVPANVQVFLLTWAEPYRVGCMSISSAFAFGFDKKYCAKGCKPTYPSRYADSHSGKPYDHYGIRPTMLLAATDFADAKALIDRGVAADSLQEKGVAYLVTTADKSRSVRRLIFPAVISRLSGYLPIYSETSQGITDKNDVMFYFTGDVFVKGLNSNTYLPGAMADHLTSAGGQLTDSRQMSAIAWLKAGATGSYGTVVEPCNLLEKFPNPLVAMKKYLQGETLIEAYWKSVRMPGQGVFIGEPLARPYGGYQLKEVENALLLSSPTFSNGYYRVEAADQQAGPYQLIMLAEVTVFNKTISIPKPYRAFYTIKRLEQYGQPPVDHLIPR